MGSFLPNDLLTCVFRFMSATTLMTLTSKVSKGWAEITDKVLEERCRLKCWALPRRPRGDAAQHKHFPWRSLYRRHMCVACSEAGEFAIRKYHAKKGQPFIYLICPTCTKRSKVQDKLKSDGYWVDLIGATGKRLLPDRKRHKPRQRRDN